MYQPEYSDQAMNVLERIRNTQQRIMGTTIESAKPFWQQFSIQLSSGNFRLSIQ